MQITSNQNDKHEDLEKIVKKHLESTYQKPIAVHSLRAFDQLFEHVSKINLPIILDSGCGNGTSSKRLSKKYPDSQIIGVDKSLLRLSKADYSYANISFCRCELEDFWRLAIKAKLQINTHYLLYPNPWPKKKHLMRRWHGHPVFPDLLKLGKMLILRSDWRIYIDEFELALITAGINNICKQDIITENGISAFEQKYIEQKRELFELSVKLI